MIQSAGLAPDWSYTPKAVAVNRARKLAKILGCEVGEDNNEVLKCLRKKSAKTILENEQLVSLMSPVPFGPTVDGEFLRATPREYLDRRSFSPDVPVLIGTNANEGFMNLMYFMKDIMPNAELTIEEKDLPKAVFERKVTLMYGQYPPSVS